MTSANKTLFVSDIHLGAGKDWDWFDINNEGPILRAFFEYVSARADKDNDIKDLVLLGDVFDLWVCPHDVCPQTINDVIAVQQDIIRSIVNISDKVNILYVNGNHDFQVTSGDINRIFRGRVKHIGNSYRRGNILAEHGHQYALFNCPDPKNGGYLRLPLGYFITRLNTSLDKQRMGKIMLICQIIDETFQMMGPEKLPESILDALKDAIEMSAPSRKVVDFVMGNLGPDQKFDDVRARYQNLFEDWKNSKGFWLSTQMILCEMNHLDPIADSLCRDGVEIVVFGHSHSTQMDKDSWLTKNRIYANCGYWCGLGTVGAPSDAHFVETDGQTVDLMKFFEEKATVEKTLFIK